ncbi:MAG: hypothetical protein ACLFS8_03000 [Clostridia bacterium]
MKASQGIATFLIVAAITLVGNWVGMDQIDPIEALPGMLILVGIAFVGWGVSEALNRVLPPIVFVSLLAIILTTPWTPGNEWVVSHTTNVNFLATCTPVLAYAGVSIGKDIDKFVAMGWRILVVGAVVLTGTFIGSAAVAHIAMVLLGQA